MKNEEAKFLLRAYRANGADASDPAFAAALAQAKADPELAAWFERERTLDRVIVERVSEIVPPKDLRASILAGARRAPVKAVVWRQPVWLAAAAMVMVALTLTALWPRLHVGTGTFGADREWAEFAAKDAVEARHGGKGEPGEPARALHAYVSDPSHALLAGVPIDFAQLKASGCRTIDFAGFEVAEICFARGQGREFHLYVALSPDVKTSAPMFLQEGGRAVATWSDGKHVFALVGDGIDAVKSLL